MVDLLKADPSLSVRTAAEKAARGLEGVSSTHVERLRRKYRKLLLDGRLPGPKPPAQPKSREDIIRDYYDQRDRDREEARKEFARARKEAESLGIDLSGTTNTNDLVQAYERRKEYLVEVTEGPPGVMIDSFTMRGIHKKEAAIAALADAVEELKTIDQKIEVLKILRRYSFMLTE